MIKKIKLLIVLLFATIGLISCGSASNAVNNKTNNAEESEKVEAKQKYTVTLNLENYKSFIDLRAEAAGTYYRMCFYGSLSYAFYDNVVITYVTGDSNENQTLSLSSGGYGTYYTVTPRTPTYKITNVSGTVIYWI